MNLKTYLFLLSSAFTLHASAQFTEQFNSRRGIAGADVKNYLQASCWHFSSFISSNKPGELIEGDGSLLSTPPVNTAIPAGIYSPLLDMQSQVSVMFKYRFLSRLNAKDPSIKIYLANAGNEPEILLDTIAVDAQNNSVFAYNRLFNHIPPGPHKLFIQYSHHSSDARLIIDDIGINADMHYPGGCNSAPVANADMVSLDESGVSKTSITTNDSDIDNDQFRPRIETGSADGVVKLNGDNSVAFKANPNFKGGITEFSYRICETGVNGLCSESTKVILNVPTGPKTALLEFTGEYLQGGNIDLHWRTSYPHATVKFEVERSLDGKSWQHAGTVVASETQQYVFNDHVNKNTANRNDIYYRIKELKKNEAVVTSKLLMLRVYNSNGVRMVSVSPNPDKNDISVTLQLNQPSITSMKVVNSTGDEVFRKTVKTAAEVNNILLDGTSKLQPGEYTLDVIINSRERMFVPLLKD